MQRTWACLHQTSVSFLTITAFHLDDVAKYIYVGGLLDLILNIFYVTSNKFVC